MSGERRVRTLVSAISPAEEYDVQRPSGIGGVPEGSILQACQIAHLMSGLHVAARPFAAGHKVDQRREIAGFYATLVGRGGSRYAACLLGAQPSFSLRSLGTMNFDPSKIDLLLVDDDADFRETLARRFTRRGFQVQEARHGEQALQLAERRQFDVAVLDMVMPGMSGIEVLEQLKLTHPECEVIMLTGQGTIETAVEAMKLGAYDYLTKPFPLAGAGRC